MKVLVTGGAGYIGGNTCLELLRSGYDVQVVDNLNNGNVEALDRVKCQTNRDLARAHVAAVGYIQELAPFEAINIGTGNGISVLQMISEFEQQSSKRVNYQIAPRRPGDAAEVWADVSQATRMIGFQAKFGVSEMCRDTWHWQSANPNGYKRK